MTRETVFLPVGRDPAGDAGQRQERSEHPGTQNRRVNDATWLAQLAADGLLRSSFVPPEPIRELRDLTRGRASVVRDRTRQIHRLEKLLESSGIKLSSVVTSLTGVSSRAMLDALVAGERDPGVLAALAKGRLKSKIPDLVEALTGRFGEHHTFLTRLYLEQIDAHTAMIEALTARIEVSMEPFRLTRGGIDHHSRGLDPGR